MELNKTTKASDWKDGFLFVGNEPVLDFLNTRPIQNGKPTELLGDFGALLRWFQAAGLVNFGEARSFQSRWGGTTRAEKTTEAMRELREKLRTDVLGWRHGGAVRRATLEELNRVAAEHPMRTRLTAKSGVYSTELWFELHEPEDLFGPLSHSVATMFATVDRERVRKCDQCVLLFRDVSKKGTRRWCSMQLCGNRLKVAAYAARQRQGTER